LSFCHSESPVRDRLVAQHDNFVAFSCQITIMIHTKLVNVFLVEIRGSRREG